jgi:hypothetical protein
MFIRRCMREVDDKYRSLYPREPRFPRTSFVLNVEGAMQRHLLIGLGIAADEAQGYSGDPFVMHGQS